MYAGRMVEGGESETITQSPAHPYTQLLIDSAPDPDRIEATRWRGLADRGNGEPPSLIHPPSGCRFHPRCPKAMPRCTTDLPVRLEIGDEPGHWAACWLYDPATVQRRRPGSARSGPKHAAEGPMIFLLQRIGFYLFTAWAAITLNFFIPRVIPGDPVKSLLARYQGQMSSEAMQSLYVLFGLDGNASVFAQYGAYWSRSRISTSACRSRTSRCRWPP